MKDERFEGLKDMADEKFKALIDPITRVVRITCSGFWSQEEAIVYLGRIAHTVKAARLNRIGARVLVDNRNAAVQTFAVLGQVSAMVADVYQSTDYLAIVVASPLLKRQMERLPSKSVTRVFEDIDQASDWLLSNSC